MEPAIIVDIFWGERENDQLRMHNFCLGTTSFSLPPQVKLTGKEQKAYQWMSLCQSATSVFPEAYRKKYFLFNMFEMLTSE